VRPKPNITGYVGYWASGKSLFMAREIERREAGDPRLLIGNNFGWKSENSVELNTIADVVDFAGMETPGWRKLLAIDEVQSLARARSAAVFPPAADVVFTQGRKLQLSVLWTSQHWRFVDVNIRRVTDCVIQCQGHWFKRLSDRGELPERWRPRLFSGRVYYSPDPEALKLPDAPDRMVWDWFQQSTADRYDTMALVKNMALLMREQIEGEQNARLLAGVLAAISGGDSLSTETGTDPTGCATPSKG